MRVSTGHAMVLNVICVFTRYLFLRALKTKEAIEVAWSLYDIILDAGVVFVVVQSDNGKEFVNRTMRNLMQLLGVRQVFSMALHPQSQAICERSHKEV